MKFKVGNQIRRTANTWPGHPLTAGNLYKVTSVSHDASQIKISGDDGWWNSNKFELVAAASPAGSGSSDSASRLWGNFPSLPINVTFVPEEIVASTKSEEGVRVPRRCDCGGLKTFGTLAPEAHSHWCSSRSTKGSKI